jgi:hypothetical protein
MATLDTQQADTGGWPWTRDLISALIGLWIVAGINLDGWAHVHVPELETFFTPWHATFYSGLVAFVLWLGIVLLRLRRPGDNPITTLQRLPAGYRGGVLGATIFAVGGAGDMFWHELIGIEVSIDALLSPPHLVLLTGGLLIVGTAWRSQRARSSTATLPELISLVSLVALCGFFLNYLSAFEWVAPTFLYAEVGGGDDGLVAAWMGDLLVTTVLLVVPLLWQLRDGRHRIGTFALIVLGVGSAHALAMSYGESLVMLMTTVAACTVAALACDVALARLPWARWTYGLPTVIGVGVLGVWGLQLAAVTAFHPIRWPATLWVGSLLVTAAVAGAVAAVLWRPAPTALAGTPAALDAAEPVAVEPAGTVSAAAERPASQIASA